MPTEAQLRKGELLSSIKSKMICSFLNNHSFSTALYRGLIPPMDLTNPLTTSSVLDIRLVLFLHFEMEYLSGDTENQNTKRTHMLLVVKMINLSNGQSSSQHLRQDAPSFNRWGCWTPAQLHRRSIRSCKNLKFICPWSVCRLGCCISELTSPKFPLDHGTLVPQLQHSFLSALLWKSSTSKWKLPASLPWGDQTTNLPHHQPYSMPI